MGTATWSSSLSGLTLRERTFPPLGSRADTRYVPFDFHAKCHGMKWENISELVEEVDFGKMGYFWSLANEPLREQVGAFRTK